MFEKIVRAKTAFRGHFTIGSVDRVRWLEIKEGTQGILSEDGKIVVFDYGQNDSVSASVYYGDGINTNTTFVHHTHFEEVS